MLKLLFIIFILLSALIVILAVKEGKLTVKYSLIWLFSAFFTMLAVIMPNFLQKMADFFGFQVVSNMVFLLGLLILFSMVFSLSVIVSDQHKKVKMLIQELSILKKKIKEKNKK